MPELCVLNRLILISKCHVHTDWHTETYLWQQISLKFCGIKIRDQSEKKKNYQLKFFFLFYTNNDQIKNTKN